MKKSAAAIVFAITAATMAQGGARFPNHISGPARKLLVSEITGQENAPAKRKVIQDPAEFNAYMAALNTHDPAQKAAAMMAFTQKYPNSIVNNDALEQARAAYQAAGNIPKLEEVARLILKDNPRDTQSLAILVAILRAQGTPQSAAEAGAYAERGLQALSTWAKPERTTDAEFEKIKKQVMAIFNGAAGFSALQNKNYVKAANYYMKSMQIDPDNMQDVYQLSIADLESNPMDLNGFWYAAKAIHLAGNNAPAVQAISAYAKAKYKAFRGSYEGWDEIVTAAARQSAPPQNFASSTQTKSAACLLAVEAVKQNDPAALSFSDFEFILGHANCSPANKEAAEKVWAAIQDKQKHGTIKLKLLGVKVISATKGTIEAAITDESQQANKADVHVVLQKPVVHPPAAGSMTDITGIFTSYTPEPFLFIMEKGELPGKTPPRPTHRPPAQVKK